MSGAARLRRYRSILAPTSDAGIGHRPGGRSALAVPVPPAPPAGTPVASPQRAWMASRCRGSKPSASSTGWSGNAGGAARAERAAWGAGIGPPPSSSVMSLAVSTSFAPWRIQRMAAPRQRRMDRPGMAKTRACLAGQRRAVMSDPLCRAASTTSTPRARPATMRLRLESAAVARRFPSAVRTPARHAPRCGARVRGAARGRCGRCPCP